MFPERTFPGVAPLEAGRTGATWVAWAGLGGAALGSAGQTDAEWYIAGPINLIFSMLAFAVAHSELPGRPRDSLTRRTRALTASAAELPPAPG